MPITATVVFVFVICIKELLEQLTTAEGALY